LILGDFLNALQRGVNLKTKPSEVSTGDRNLSDRALSRKPSNLAGLGRKIAYKRP